MMGKIKLSKIVLITLLLLIGMKSIYAYSGNFEFTFQKKGGSNGTNKLYLTSKSDNTFTAYTDKNRKNKTKSITPPTKKGYGFEGYYASDYDKKLISRKGNLRNDNLKYYISNKKKLGDVSLSASYKPFDHFIKLTSKGVTLKDAGTTVLNFVGKDEGVVYNSSSVQIEKIKLPTASGYDFKGYYVTYNNKEVQVIDAKGNILLSSYTKDINSNYKTYNEKGYQYVSILKGFVGTNDNTIMVYAKWSKNTNTTTKKKTTSTTSNDSPTIICYAKNNIVKPGNTKKFSYQILKNTNNKKVTISVKDASKTKSIFTYNNSTKNITGKKEGSGYLTVKVGSVSKNCKIYITKDKSKLKTELEVDEKTNDMTKKVSKVGSINSNKKTTKTSKKKTSSTSASKLKLTCSPKSVVKGKKITLKASGGKKAYTFSSSNKKIATVTNKGAVKGVKVGTTTITVKDSSKKTASCKVKVLKTETIKITAVKSKNKSLKSSNKETQQNKEKKFAKVLKASDLKKIIICNSDSGAYKAQGFAITDKYYICSLVTPNNSRTVLHIYNKNTKKKTNTLKDDFYHSNGMTYNSKTKKVYVAHMKDGKYSEISADKLPNKISKKTKKLSNDLSSIAYDSYTDQFYAAKGRKVYVYNSNFKLVKKFNKKVSNTPQDIAAYKGLILVIDYTPKGSYINTIYVYRASTGAYIGKYQISGISSELESISYDSQNNNFALYFHDYNKGTIYTTSSIKLSNYVN